MGFVTDPTENPTCRIVVVVGTVYSIQASPDGIPLAPIAFPSQVSVPPVFVSELPFAVVFTNPFHTTF